MSKPLIALSLAAAMAAAPALAAGPDHDHETAEAIEAIKAAVFDYFEGQGERSAARLERAFRSDTAMMVGVLKGEDGETNIMNVPISEVIPRWSSGEPSTDERKGRILSMHIEDARLATVMFDSNGRFTDALTLAKIDGEWKIMSKVFIRQGD